MFITFEGIDGCGKTTQLRLLQNALEARGIPVVATREPGGTALAETLRNFLLHGREKLDSHAELLLFGAARAQHVAEVIRPALDQGAWVLSDRFADSSEAYQGFGLELDAEFVRRMNEFATGNLQPHKTFFLDVAPETALQRRAGEKSDRIEARGLEFQARVRAGFLQIARRERERFVVLDGALEAQEIHARIGEQIGL